MKLKYFIGIGLSVMLMVSSLNMVSADADDEFWYDYIKGIYSGEYMDNGEYLIPMITSPTPYDTIISSEGVKIRWKYTGGEKCVVTVKDKEGNISELAAEEGNKVTILPNKLSKGEKYIVTVKAGNVASEPFTLNVADNGEEILEIVRRTNIEPAEPRIDKDIIAPEGAFDSKESADKMMKTINVNVWKLAPNGQKTTATVPLTVNAQLADTVSKIFNEIYQNDLHFPISSLGCYSYRTTASGERLSEHAMGTAIDVNPNENYCVYSDGTTVGSFYEPYSNPYSVTPEIINIFRKYNFYWGAYFGDYMHFSYFAT